MSIDRLNAGLPNFDALGALERPGLDGRQAQLDRGTGVQAPDEVAPAGQAPIDEGEHVLNARAWDEGAPRLLAADGFQLGGADRGQDLDAGVEAMVAPLG